MAAYPGSPVSGLSQSLFCPGTRQLLDPPAVTRKSIGVQPKRVGYYLFGRDEVRQLAKCVLVW